MSLATAVKFRFLAAQLTKKELHRFLDCNTNIIITALFNQILNTSINQQSEGDNINNAISNIILSRQEKPKPIPTQNIQLNQLPKRLIGEISSFLDQNQNINFGKTNRFIYLGCNSPNLLKELDLIKIENYSHVNLALYPSVKDLRLNLNKFNEFELMPAINGLPRPVMNELETIELNGKDENDIDIDNFLGFTQINTNNVTKLRCSQFGGADYGYFPADKFMKLLTKFPNIQYLDLFLVIVELNDLNLYHIKIKDLYNLKRLNLMTECDITKSLINTFGNNLDFLSFVEYNNDFDFSLQNIDFGKLQELAVWSPTNKSLNDILLTAKNLKKIAIRKAVMTPNETKKIMIKLIKTCKSLELIFVEFLVNSAAAGGEIFKYTLDGLENGLKETKKWKRNQMKVRFIVDCNECDDKFNPNDFMLNNMVKQIMDCLLDSEINDFMLRFSFRRMSKKIDTTISLKELKSKYLSTKVKVSCFKHDFVFTNTDCKINGLSESWKITLCK